MVNLSACAGADNGSSYSQSDRMSVIKSQYQMAVIFTPSGTLTGPIILFPRIPA